jgi:hypothetical protein
MPSRKRGEAAKDLASSPRRGLSRHEDMTMGDDLLDKGQRDRSHIAMGQSHEVQYWTKHLGVTKEELRRAIDKVGNSAAAVRKELGLMGKPHA